jgi:hypothetical protein
MKIKESDKNIAVNSQAEIVNSKGVPIANISFTPQLIEGQISIMVNGEIYFAKIDAITNIENLELYLDESKNKINLSVRCSQITSKNILDNSRITGSEYLLTKEIRDLKILKDCYEKEINSLKNQIILYKTLTRNTKEEYEFQKQKIFEELNKIPEFLDERKKRIENKISLLKDKVDLI